MEEEKSFSKEEIFNMLSAKKAELVSKREQEEENLDSIEKSKIQDIKFLGTIKVTDENTQELKIVPVYRVEILDINTDKLSFEYYAGDEKVAQEIEGQITELNQDLGQKKLSEILPQIADKKRILDELEKTKKIDKSVLEENGIYSLNDLETEKDIEEYAKVLGVEKEEIKSITDIEKPEEENEEELDTEEVERLTAKQEIDAKTKVNNYYDMERALGMSGVKKFVVVYSEEEAKISERGHRNNSRYSMIAIMKDGTSRSLDDKLEPNNSAGVRSSKGRTQTYADGYTREDTGMASIYNIKGTNKSFSFQNGQYGEVQVFYGQMSRGIGENEGNEFNGTQVETSNTKRIYSDIKSMEDPYSGIYTPDNQNNEAKKHFEHGDERVALENSDGDQKTQAKCDYDIDDKIPGLSYEMTWRELVESTGKRLEEVQKDFFERIEDHTDPDEAVYEIRKEAIDVDAGDDVDEGRTLGDTHSFDRELGPKH